MKKIRTQIALNVFLNDRLVGFLIKETSGAIHFQYDHSWLTWDNALPISLSLPLREKKYDGDVRFHLMQDQLHLKTLPYTPAMLVLFFPLSIN